MGKKTKKAKKQKLKKAKKVSVKLNLRKASKVDFLQRDGINQAGKKKWKFIYGLPYWLYNSKGVIENQEYIFDENTDIEEFSNYLTKEQVLVPVKYFDKAWEKTVKKKKGLSKQKSKSKKRSKKKKD